MEILITIIIALSAFVATNLDDIFILMSFFVLDDNKIINVILGQYLGFVILLIFSFLCYNFKFLLHENYIAILGFFPIIIGIKYFWNYRTDIYNISMVEKRFGPVNNNAETVIKGSALKKTLHVVAVTVANGGDNIAVYIPLFLTLDTFQLGITTLIFLTMLGVWCALGYKMVSNKIFGEKIRVYGHVILPSVLILIGFGIIFRNLQMFQP